VQTTNAQDSIFIKNKDANQKIKSRTELVAAGNIVGYGGAMFALNAAWYAHYPKSNFHFFNDDKEWLQVDKVGHMYSAYEEGIGSMALWKWTGMERKKYIWLGGLCGFAYQSVIEVLDGFSAEWGFSPGDFTANVLGSAILISQQLAWDEQRIKIKFSFHRNNYNSADLEQRANTIFGKSTAERYLKDYNAQTYWASANINDFFPKSKFPVWLSIAVGYGADGMFGAFSNTATDSSGTIIFNRTDIKRYRQWYLSPDIDFSKIKTRRKGLKFLFTVLDAIKFPAPAIEFSNGKFKFHPIQF
jgi:hypothetical protein